MTFWIKNCGLTTREAIAASANTGATHIGLMHYAPSPRHLSIEAGALLRSFIPANMQTVAVLVKPDDETLQAIIQTWYPEVIQIHAEMDAERLRQITERYQLPIWLAVAVKNQADIAQAQAAATQAGAAAMLLDAAKNGMHGGTGESFDWSILRMHAPTMPWLLAGGLNPENVTDAIKLTKPHGVDVSSGIEAQKGKKSLEKIAAFNTAVLTTRT